MSDSSWHCCIRAGSLIAIVIALVVAATIPHEGRLARGGTKHPASQYETPTYDQCGAKLRALGLDESATSDKSEPNTPKKDRYYELCQQTRSADAAWDAAWYAWLQSFFACIGIVGLVTTVYLTAKAANAASEAADHAARSVDIQIRQEKPFIHINIDGVIATKKYPEHLRIPIRNSGKTPAVLLDYVVCAASAECLPEWPPRYDTPLGLESTLLGPSSDGSLTWIFLIGDQPLKNLFADDQPVVVWGYVRYEDVFGKTWRRGFGFKFNFFFEDYPPGDKESKIVWSRDGGTTYNYDLEESGGNAS